MRPWKGPLTRCHKMRNRQDRSWWTA